jgi:hypothetical protein
VERLRRGARRPGRQIVGGPERFDDFFDREARGLLAVAVLVAGDRDAAEAATRRTLRRALRRWDTVGRDPDPLLVVRRWTIDAARRRRWAATARVDTEARDGLESLRTALWSLPRRRCRAVVLAVVDGVLATGDVLVSAVDCRSALAVPLDDMSDTVGGRDALRRLVEAARTRLADASATGAPPQHLRPVPPQAGPRSRRLVPILVVGAAALAVFAVLSLESTDEGPGTTGPEGTLPPAEDVVVDDSMWWWDPEWVGEVPQVTLAGWEAVGPSPVPHGPIVAAAGVGDVVFVWRIESSVPSATPFEHTVRGFLYDPEARSRRIAEPPDGSCAVVFGEAVPIGDLGVLLSGAGPGCTTAMVYTPHSDSWTVVDDALVAPLPGASSLVWTGDLLVSPLAGVALDWESGSIVPVPALPQGLPGAWVRAHWTGDRVLAVGSTGLYNWAPGDAAWETLDPTPYLHESGSSAWTTHGLLVLDPDDGAKFHDGDSWRAAPGLFWDGTCWAEVVAVSTPVVRTCGGFMVWDGAADRWVPFPHSSLDDDAVLVEVDGDLYTVGAMVRRLVIEYDDDGSMLASSTVPIGSLYVDVPSGFTHIEHLGPDRRPLGLRSQTSWTTGAVFEGGPEGARCTVEVTTWPFGRPSSWPELHAPHPVRLFVDGPRTVTRGWGVPDLVGFAVSSEVAAGIALPEGVGLGDRWDDAPIVVLCFGDDRVQAHDLAVRLASGVWSRFEGHFAVAAEPGDVLWEVREPEGFTEVPFPYPSVPDRARSEAARDRFGRCVFEHMAGSGLVLGGLNVLVDGDDELLALAFRVVRPRSSPPVARLSDDVRRRCLSAAEVGTSFLADHALRAGLERSVVELQERLSDAGATGSP